MSAAPIFRAEQEQLTLAVFGELLKIPVEDLTYEDS